MSKLSNKNDTGLDAITAIAQHTMFTPLDKE